MANNLDSNFTLKLAKVFLEKFETIRTLSKNVNTQFIEGKFDPSTGQEIAIKRPTSYKTKRSPTGDLTGTPSNIITGQAKAIVQDYISVDVAFNEADQALKMDQLDELLEPMATQIVTDLETDFAAFMMKNTALLSGTVGTPVTTWDHVAGAGSIMQSTGVPMSSRWHYAINPFTQRKLASEQRSLGAGGAMGADIKSANARAMIAENFAGMDVRTATTLDSYTTFAGADRTGSLSANPDVTYLTAKDTMTQVLAVENFENNLEIRAGETIQITGRNRLNLSTRKVILNDTGTPVVFTGTVVSAVTLSATGTGNITITGPAIFETAAGDGAYNTVDSAPIQNDVVVLLGGGAAAAIIQPNLFWHKDAFAIGSVEIEKLFSTDTLATTTDGLQIRVSKGADIITNKQIVRFDFRPAYGVLNPFFAGKSFG